MNNRLYDYRKQTNKQNLTRRENVQMINISHTYRISMQSSVIHIQPLHMFELLYAPLQQNHCTRSRFLRTQWPCLKVNVIYTDIKLYNLVMSITIPTLKRSIYKYPNVSQSSKLLKQSSLLWLCIMWKKTEYGLEQTNRSCQQLNSIHIHMWENAYRSLCFLII